MLMGHVQTFSMGRGTEQHFPSKLDAYGGIFPPDQGRCLTR